ncbi:MAG: hypothetical protein KDA22_02960 [Phycisphaerales bacterium]|nr:hypothetical protein [Phycisphaerales bacterium]
MSAMMHFGGAIVLALVGFAVAATGAAPDPSAAAARVDDDQATPAPPAHAPIEQRHLTTRDGTVVDYALVLPRDFDASKTYPALLALPPGPQTASMVEAGLDRYWGKQASERGWIVISPAAPNGVSFYSGSERLVPELLDAVQSQFKVEGGKFHLAGASNGGRSAFRVALDHPDRFLSLTVLPGMPPRPEDFAMLPSIAKLPVTMYVGGSDTAWLEQMKRTRDALVRAGGRVTLTVLPNEGHVPPSLDGAVIMERLDEVRREIKGIATPNDRTGAHSSS